MKKQWKIFLAFVSLGLISGAVQAELIEMSLSGTLEDGGTIEGTFSYDSTVVDWNSNDIQGYFGFVDYIVTVKPNSAPEFIFTPCSPFVSDILRTAISPDNISVRFSNCGTDDSVRLTILFLDAKQTPTPWHPNVAPFPADFGEFQPRIEFPNGGLSRSQYEYYQRINEYLVQVSSAEVNTADSDSDGDGVNDDDDLCENTTIPEGAAYEGLRGKRWALVNADTSFDTAVSTNQSYTTTDTRGCSCEEIAAALGAGQGHFKFGCSNSLMQQWVQQLP